MNVPSCCKKDLMILVWLVDRFMTLLNSSSGISMHRFMISTDSLIDLLTTCLLPSCLNSSMYMLSYGTVSRRWIKK
jgi:hypothetical protein